MSNDPNIASMFNFTGTDVPLGTPSSRPLSLDQLLYPAAGIVESVS